MDKKSQNNKNETNCQCFNTLRKPLSVKNWHEQLTQHQPKSVTPNSLCCSTVNSTFADETRNLRQRRRFVTKARAQTSTKAYATNNNICDIITTTTTIIIIISSSSSSSNSTLANQRQSETVPPPHQGQIVEKRHIFAMLKCTLFTYLFFICLCFQSNETRGHDWWVATILMLKVFSFHISMIQRQTSSKIQSVLSCRQIHLW